MNRAEFYEKYGSMVVTFSSYYKFTFNYSADLGNGKRLTCSVGGNSDDIYQHSVTAGDKETVLSLGPFAGAVFDGTTETDSFYDY